jgi:hypothetical protein
MQTIIETPDIRDIIRSKIPLNGDDVKGLYNASIATKSLVRPLLRLIFAGNCSEFQKGFLAETNVVKYSPSARNVALNEFNEGLKNKTSVEFRKIEQLFISLYSAEKTISIVYYIRALKNYFLELSKIRTFQRDKIIKEKIKKYSILEYEYSKYFLCMYVRTPPKSQGTIETLTHIVETLYNIKTLNVIDDYYQEVDRKNYNIYIQILYYMFNNNKISKNIRDNYMLYKTLKENEDVIDLPIDAFKNNTELHKAVMENIIHFINKGGLKFQLNEANKNIDLSLR